MPHPAPAPGTSPEEHAFLQDYDADGFDRVSVTVDVVLLAVAPEGLQSLLIRREDHPCKGRWALPGGFVRVQETLEEASNRILATKTGIRGVTARQFKAFGKPDRDPRMRIVTIAHLALVEPSRFREVALPEEACKVARLEHAKSGKPVPPVLLTDSKNRPLDPAFDHAHILQAAVEHLRDGLENDDAVFQLLPPAFTMSALQKVYETVLGRRLNKDSFRRRMMASGRLEMTGDLQEEVDHRPAFLFQKRTQPASR